VKHRDYFLDVVRLRVEPGAALFDMQRRACIAALDHNCVASFVHNDRRFSVDVSDILELCVQDKSK
jgi:hypothetical protein